jgi:hypothetical protein
MRYRLVVELSPIIGEYGLYWQANLSNSWLFGPNWRDVPWDNLGPLGSYWRLERCDRQGQAWNGLCVIGESVEVVRIAPNAFVLSKNWQGVISDHSDLELWLKEQVTIWRRHIRYCCEIYSFGTITVPRGSVEASVGEPVGSSRVSHRRGSSPDRNEAVQLNMNDHTIQVGDALFRIIESR